MHGTEVHAKPPYGTWDLACGIRPGQVSLLYRILDRGCSRSCPCVRRAVLPTRRVRTCRRAGNITTVGLRQLHKARLPQRFFQSVWLKILRIRSMYGDTCMQHVLHSSVKTTKLRVKLQSATFPMGYPFTCRYVTTKVPHYCTCSDSSVLH